MLGCFFLHDQSPKTFDLPEVVIDCFNILVHKTETHLACLVSDSGLHSKHIARVLGAHRQANVGVEDADDVRVLCNNLFCARWQPLSQRQAGCRSVQDRHAAVVPLEPQRHQQQRQQLMRLTGLLRAILCSCNACMTRAVPALLTRALFFAAYQTEAQDLGASEASGRG